MLSPRPSLAFNLSNAGPHLIEPSGVSMKVAGSENFCVWETE